MSTVIEDKLTNTVGAVAYFAKNSAPIGWLKCNGAGISTTTYANLFAKIGYTFGGSGGTFNLPDKRGEFLRGWDDGRGVDSGRAFGSAQGDIFQGHYHNIYHVSTPNSMGSVGSEGLRVDGTLTSGGYVKGPITGIHGTPRIGTETRPRNVAMLACIKY